MAEFSGQTNDSLSSNFLLRAFNVFKAAKNRACNTKYGSLPGVDLFWDLYFVYMYAYIYCPHVVMSLNGRLLHFADECMMEECIDRSVFVPELASASCGCGGCLTSLTLNINNLTGMSSFGQDRQSCMHARPKCMPPVFVVVLVQKMLFCSHCDLTNVDCTCRRFGGGGAASGKW